MKNLLLGGLLFAFVFSAQAASVLTGLKSGDIQDAKKVLAQLEKLASEQKSGEKELTEFLMTAIKEAYTAEFQLKEAKKQRQKDLAEAEKQVKAAKSWLTPNALGSTSPDQAEKCLKKSEMLRTQSIRVVDEANDKLKEKLVGLQEAEDYLLDANRREDALIIRGVTQTMARQLSQGTGGLNSFWGARKRKKNPFSPESRLMPKNSDYQLKVVTGEGSFELTRRLRRKVDEALGKDISPEEKDRLVKEVKSICLFTFQEMDARGKKATDDAVFILLEEFEPLGVDGVQSLKWAQRLSQSPSSAYKKYGEAFQKKLLDKMSMDYHDTAQTTYKCWTAAEAGAADAFWQFYQAYSGKIESMIRLNCSRENAEYWLKKARAAGHEEAQKTILSGEKPGAGKRRPLPDDSAWWKNAEG